MSLSLKQVHAVEAESLDLDKGLDAPGLRFGDCIIDEECIGIAGASFDI